VLVDVLAPGERLADPEFQPMTPGVVMEIGRQAIEVTLLLAAPPLVAALLVGCWSALLPGCDPTDEATLQFVPKLVVMFIVLLLFGPWMLQYLMDYIQRLFREHPAN
jgi:flagellar biosynthetic protein FliQ